jgi:hypothetical protein
LLFNITPDPPDPPEPPPSNGLAEQVAKNTMSIEELTERVNIIDDYLRSYGEA